MISMKVTSRNNFEKLRKELRPRAGRAINNWARNTFNIAQQLVPYRTGELHDSGEIVNFSGLKGDGRQKGVAKSIRYTAGYAVFVHNGTEHQEAQPWLLVAFQHTRQALIDELSKIAAL